MRKVICRSCSFSATEADRNWDIVNSSGRCPKCSAPLQAQLLAESFVAYSPSSSESTYRQIAMNNSVVVTDIQIPFGSMVVFMVKWVIASIPAIIILMIFFKVVAVVAKFAGLNLGLFRH